MVRFGADDHVAKHRTFHRFNSSMVRFGAGNRCRTLSAYRVSIPVWCDLEILAHLINHKLTLFQFQYGAIWRKKWHRFQKVLRKFQFQYGAIWSGEICDVAELPGRFNSSMVRFGVVKIFDNIKAINLFQFQYGAIWS